MATKWLQMAYFAVGNKAGMMKVGYFSRQSSPTIIWEFGQNSRIHRKQCNQRFRRSDLQSEPHGLRAAVLPSKSQESQRLSDVANPFDPLVTLQV